MQNPAGATTSLNKCARDKPDKNFSLLLQFIKEKYMSKVGPKKVEVQDAKPIPGRRARALKAGPHGKIKNANGTTQSTPSSHDLKNVVRYGSRPVVK